MSNTAFSVVISTYAGEKPEHFKEAIDSLISQTVPPTEIIVVYDGPVPQAMKDVTKNTKNTKGIEIREFDIEHNSGRGKARNLGVSKACHDIVAIMDSDDISKNRRFELQLPLLVNEGLDLVAGFQEEFYSESPNEIVGRKAFEVTDDAIKKSLKFRCMLPNPSIIFKKSAFEAAGGYGEYRSLNEDHDLFIKMSMQGAKFGAISSPVIKVRISREQRRRRGGFRAIREDIRFRLNLYRKDYYNLIEFSAYTFLVICFRLTPPSFKNFLYKNILRTSES